MYKRLTIRLVDDLATALKTAAHKRGVSMNMLVSSMVWDFITDFNEKNEGRQ